MTKIRHWACLHALLLLMMTCLAIPAYAEAIGKCCDHDFWVMGNVSMEIDDSQGDVGTVMVSSPEGDIVLMDNQSQVREANMSVLDSGAVVEPFGSKVILSGKTKVSVMCGPDGGLATGLQGDTRYVLDDRDDQVHILKEGQELFIDSCPDDEADPTEEIDRIGRPEGDRIPDSRNIEQSVFNP